MARSNTEAFLSSESNGSAEDPDVDTGERPTLVPDFDPEAFARDSEMRARIGPLPDGEATIDQAARLHEEGNHEGALFLLSRLLELSPFHPAASKLAGECRKALELQCIAAIGSLGAILVVKTSPEELKGFELDNVSGFLLSRIDGSTDVETLLDLGGVPRLLALRHLRDLVERGIVGVASAVRPRVHARRRIARER